MIIPADLGCNYSMLIINAGLSLSLFVSDSAVLVSVIFLVVISGTGHVLVDPIYHKFVYSHPLFYKFLLLEATFVSLLLPFSKFSLSPTCCILWYMCCFCLQD